MFLVAYEMLKDEKKTEDLKKGIKKCEYIRDVSMSEKAHDPLVNSCLEAVKAGIDQNVWRWPENLQKCGYYEVYNHIDDFGTQSPGFKWAMEFTLKGEDDPYDFRNIFDSEDSAADTDSESAGIDD